jgi:hypothetical protein
MVHGSNLKAGINPSCGRAGIAVDASIRNKTDMAECFFMTASPLSIL